MPYHQQQRGFSLLEVLVVLLIIGLMVSMASLNLGPNRARDLGNISRNLLQQMRLAREEAILLDRQFGWLLEEVEPTEDDTLTDGSTRYRYRWLRYEEAQQQWRELRGQSGYSSRQFLPGISADLTIEGIDYELSLDKASVVDYSYERGLDESTDEQAEELLVPQLMFLSSGEVTAFSLSLSLLNSLRLPVRISANIDGTLLLEDNEE